MASAATAAAAAENPVQALPSLLLGRILAASGNGGQPRLVCRHFRQAFDAAATQLSTFPGLAAARPAWGLPPSIPVPRRLLLSMQHLRSLSVHTQRLGPQGSAELAELLRSADAPLATLQELRAWDERGPVPSAAGAADLACAVLAPPPGQRPQLTHLDLRDASPHGEGIARLAGALLAATHLTALQHLELAAHCMPATQSLARLANALRRSLHLSSLCELLLHSMGGGGGAAHVAAAVLQCGHFSRLHTLGLAAMRVDDEGMGELAAALCAGGHLRCLQRLALHDTNLTNEGLSTLAGALTLAVHLTGLQALELLDCIDVSDDGVGCLVDALLASSHLAGLRALRLTGTSAGRGGGEALAALLARAGAAAGVLPDLELLDLSRNAAIGITSPMLPSEILACPARSKLRELCLEQHRLSHEGAAALAAALQGAKHLGRLERINLGGNRYGEAAACELVLALRDNAGLTGLRSLRLGELGDEAALQLASALCAADHFTGLTSLHVELHAAAGRDAACALALTACGGGGGAASLRELRLDRAALGPEGAVNVAAALRAAQHLSGLRSLALTRAGLGDAGVARLTAELAAASHLSGLQELILDGNGTTDLGAVFTLCTLGAACHLGCLRSLSLAGAALSPAGVAVLAEALRAARSLSQLRVLDLSAPDGAGGGEEEQEGRGAGAVHEWGRLAEALRANGCMPHMHSLRCGGGQQANADDEAVCAESYGWGL